MALENEVFQQFLGFLETPPLWRTTENFKFPPFILKGLPDSVLSTEALIIPPRLVLGKRIEYFFEYYIKLASEEHLLAKNVVIRKNKITIGEIDFLLRNKRRNEISHVEVIYKFYLYDPDVQVEEEKWVGPNRKDSLPKKLEKLREKQFPLLYREETLPFLQSLDCQPQDIIQKVCFKANLFVPLNLEGKELPLINNECIQGFWIRKSEFKEEEYGKFQFHTPAKKDWPIEPKYGNAWCSFSELQEQITYLLNNGKSPLVWMKSDEDKFHRFFVVWW